MPKLNTTPNTVVFTEKVKPGVFTTVSGWSIRREDNGDGWYVYQLYDPAGNAVGESTFLIKDNWSERFPDIRLVSYYERYGREMDQPVKWGPAHFPRGTIVYAESVGHGNTGPEFATVSRVIQNGAKSFIIEAMETISEEGSHKDQPRSFNICWVTGIMHRPVETGRTEAYVKHEDPKHPSKVCGLYSFLNWMYRYQLPQPVSYYSPGIDFDKAIKRLKAMGLLKVNPDARRPDYSTYLVKTREAMKFLKKNPHWMLHTIDTAWKDELAEMERVYDDSDFWS